LSRIREDAEASLREMLAAALEANARLARPAEELREENARLRAENAAQAADLAVLQRMVFGPVLQRVPGDGVHGAVRGRGGA
jgi:hypothetical protein